MHNYVLHIGRHKSGTSSLQWFLHQNRRALSQLGFNYPEIEAGIAHHSIAKVFARKLRIRNSALSPSETEVVERFLQKIAGSEVPILLSSEAFQNALPKAVATVFPPGQTRIIVYIREQVEYLISGYQQKIHATEHFFSLEESMRALTVDYSKFLRSWEDAFGAEAIEVRCYSRAMLKNGDIIADFLDVLGIQDVSKLTFVDRDRNPSIGGPLLEFKRLLNGVNFGSIEKARLYSALSTVAATSDRYRERPPISETFAEEIRKSVQTSNQAVFDRYFGGRDVFKTPPRKCGEQDQEIDASDWMDILQAIKKADPILYKQISTRLLDILPPALNLMRLRSTPTGFDALVAAGSTIVAHLRGD
jgi:hypothetical protein